VREMCGSICKWTGHDEDIGRTNQCAKCVARSVTENDRWVVSLSAQEYIKKYFTPVFQSGQGWRIPLHHDTIVVNDKYIKLT
jgi:hypothetical protein